jgi:hypothetical protein
MQTNTNLRVVENNSHSTKDFTIQASGKMFHMVISGLYSNKPQSITREIWSNAFDAHAMVGKQDIPFEVTFPTALTPVFSCRDFGAGIAHENMEGFYTVLGHSTKENTNKAVGKWGVGRMSPMSYTDTFSVMSVHKGMVAYYSIQLGPDGSPQLHVLAEPTPTLAPDGLEVSFPVKRDDIPSFQRAAEIVSYGFKVQPRVKNSRDKQFQPINKLLEGEGYYFYNDSRLSGPYAQMGCVLYPINTNSLQNGLLSFNTRNVVFEFDIGDLEVTASREALSYGANDPTLENIKKVVTKIKDNMIAKAQEEIDKHPSLYRACKASYVYNRTLVNADFSWRGTPIKTMRPDLQYKGLAIHVGSKGYKDSSTIGFGTDTEVNLTVDNAIYVQDVSDKVANVRAAKRISSDLKPNARFIWVKADLSSTYVKASLATMIHDLDYPVKYVKDLHDDGAVKTGPRTKLSVNSLDESGYRRPMDMDQAMFQKGGFYFPMEGGVYPKHFINLIPMARSELLQEIILVPKPMWKKFETASQWQLIEPMLDELIKARAKTAQHTLGNRYYRYDYAKLRGFTNDTGVVGEFAKKANAARQSHYLGLTRDVWDDNLKRLGLPPINDKKVDQEYNSILDKYPLLKIDTNFDRHLTHFLHYINLINNA